MHGTGTRPGKLRNRHGIEPHMTTDPYVVPLDDKEMEEDGFIIVPGQDQCPEYGSHKGSPDYLSDIEKLIESLRASLWPLNKFIHENPELAFKEYKAHDILTTFMRSKKEWHVTTSAYGMETAWVAVYDSGKAGPVVSLNIEMGEPNSYVV